jgi:transposase
LRQRVVDFVLVKKKSKKRASETFKVHYKTVLNWVKQWETTKELSPKPRSPKPTYKLDHLRLRESVLMHPDRYQYEHAQIFGVSQSAISKALSKMGITHKKKTCHYEEQNKQDVDVFKQKLSQVTKDQCVYLDECGIKPDQIRESGWAARGEPVLGTRIGKRQPKTNLIAVLHKKTLQAPFIYEGSMNADLFNLYLKRYLLPVLKPGQIVIMDNASFHKSELTKTLIEQKYSKIVFLPPYSPDLNPIEHSWALLKRYIRRFYSEFDSLALVLDFIFQYISPFAPT